MIGGESSGVRPLPFSPAVTRGLRTSLKLTTSSRSPPLMGTRCLAGPSCEVSSKIEVAARVGPVGILQMVALAELGPAFAGEVEQEPLAGVGVEGTADNVRRESVAGHRYRNWRW